jgi:hypothetical protein
VGIPYVDGKEKFWEKAHHTLFGNSSAKVHLYPPDTETYDRVKETLIEGKGIIEETIEGIHRNIYYENVTNEYIEKHSHQGMTNKKYVDSIIRVLENQDVSRKGSMVMEGLDTLKVGWSSVQMRRIIKSSMVKRIMRR